MSKKQRNREFGPPKEAIVEPPIKADLSEVIEVDGKFVVRQEFVIEEPKPRVTSFVPRACSCCAALQKPGINYSRVKHTRGNVRYCKCDLCGNTWKEE